jgi:hypothetical protein
MMNFGFVRAARCVVEPGQLKNRSTWDSGNTKSKPKF